MLLVMVLSNPSYFCSFSDRKHGAVQRVYSNFGDCQEVAEEEEGILDVEIAESVAQDFKGLCLPAK